MLCWYRTLSLQQINQGSDVPHKYYMTEASRDQMERVVIGRRETCELEYQIEQPGTVLRWEFVTIDHSISFGWLLKEAKRKSSNASSVVSTQLTKIAVSWHQIYDIQFCMHVIILDTDSEGQQSPGPRSRVS